MTETKDHSLTEEEVREEFIKKSILKIVFTKRTGEVRHMICTTSPGLIPPESRPDDTSSHRIYPDIMRVYDIEQEGWRCFIISNLISIT